MACPDHVCNVQMTTLETALVILFTIVAVVTFLACMACALEYMHLSIDVGHEKGM